MLFLPCEAANIGFAGLLYVCGKLNGMKKKKPHQNHKHNEKRFSRFYSTFDKLAKMRAKASGEPMPVGRNETEPVRTVRNTVIFSEEMDFLSRCILDYPDIETGGQLFGYWTEGGTPVVLYAIGPGPRANHRVTFFNQDVDYLVKVGNLLRNRYGLHHIGEWHSHHKLGLAKPSSHDIHTMNSTIREKRLGRFLLCIGNINGNVPTVKAFLCDGERCSQIEWETIVPSNPIRSLIDRDLESILVLPRTGLRRQDESKSRGSIPDYASGYWLNDKENRVILNNIINYVRDYCGLPNPEVRVLLNDRREVLLRVEEGNEPQQEILFPNGFPQVAPEMKIRRRGCMERVPADGTWAPSGEIAADFSRYYRSHK